MKHKLSQSILILLTALMSSGNVQAYPQFISHGYNSCITCHYNPFGNGPINDYGRAVSGTAIAGRNFFDENKPEDYIANETAFLFKPFVQKHLRPFVGYRGLLYKANLGEERSKTEFIHMQLDANLTAKFGAKDQFITSGSFGYAPIPRSMKNTPAGEKMEKYRTREHYVGWRPKSNFGVYVGLMDKPYGIRVVEHTSFSRITPQLTMDDQAHGIIGHFTGETFEAGIDAFVGNLASEKDLRMKGFSGTFEKTLLEHHRLGASYLSQQNDYLKMSSISVHSRSQISHGTSVLFELGRTDKTPKSNSPSRLEYFSLLQNHIRTTRGLYMLNSIEYYKNSLDNSYRVRFGPGLQYFPFTKLELRADVYNTRNFNQESSSKDRWDLLMQVHAWF